MKKNDFSKCPNCNEQIYMYVGNVRKDLYQCYKTRSDGKKGEEIEIMMGSRMDRVDSVEDETFYTCDLSLAQGVNDDFESNACGNYTFKSLQELKYSVDNYAIIKRKEEADKLNVESLTNEDSIPTEWVEENIEKSLLNDDDFAKWALRIDGLLLEHFSDEIRSKIELIEIAFENNPNSSMYVNNKILNSKNNILELLDIDKEFLNKVKINEQFFLDEKFVEDCISKNGNIVLLDLFPNELLMDRNIMSLAIVNASDTEILIKGIPVELTKDVDFWLSIKKESDSYTWAYLYKFLPVSIRESKEDFEAAISIYDDNIFYAPETFKNAEFVKRFISKSISEENNLSSVFVVFCKSFLDDDINSLIDKAIQKELCTDPWDNDVDALNSYAWDIYVNRNLIPNSNSELHRASNCCKRAIDIQKDQFILDTYAHVLFALGDFDQASNLEKEAIKLAENLGEDATDYKEFLSEIKKQKLD